MGAIETARRRAAGQPILAGALAAAALFVLSLAASAIEARPSRYALPSVSSLHPSTVVLAAVSCSALLFQRRRPRAALALAVACGVAYAVFQYNLNPVLLGPVVVTTYIVAVRTDRRTTWVTVPFAAVVLVGSAMAFGSGSWLEPQKLSVLAWTGMAAALGDAVRSRRAYIAAIEERAERAERTREEEARRRVAEDRIRIARELHDVVAHHLALINAQAGVVVHLADHGADPIPAQVLEALEHIRDTSHEALQELKATVGLLRQSDDPAAPLEPAPGLAQLPELIASFARAGLEVELAEFGAVATLPPAVDLTAYRIVQESLTNVSKHAGVPTARVRLFFTAEQLAIRIEDDGRSAPMRTASALRHSADGHGLTGMSERAAVVGGRFSAGRDLWGGFRVSADLPLRPGTVLAPDAGVEAEVRVEAPVPGARVGAGADAGVVA